MARCDKCHKEVDRIFTRAGVVGWFCEKCYPGIAYSWSRQDKIRSRALMPDGTVLQGRAGLKVQSERLRRQERYRKLALDKGGD